MSPKQWLSLLTFYILYLIFGASVFYHVEHKLETERRGMANSERIEINGNYFYIDIAIRTTLLDVLFLTVASFSIVTRDEYRSQLNSYG